MTILNSITSLGNIKSSSNNKHYLNSGSSTLQNNNSDASIGGIVIGLGVVGVVLGLLLNGILHKPATPAPPKH